jgi:hypothetical protein
LNKKKKSLRKKYKFLDIYLMTHSASRIWSDRIFIILFYNNHNRATGPDISNGGKKIYNFKHNAIEGLAINSPNQVERGEHRRKL